MKSLMDTVHEWKYIRQTTSASASATCLHLSPSPLCLVGSNGTKNSFWSRECLGKLSWNDTPKSCWLLIDWLAVATRRIWVECNWHVSDFFSLAPSTTILRESRKSAFRLLHYLLLIMNVIYIFRLKFANFFLFAHKITDVDCCCSSSKCLSSFLRC